MMRQKVDHYAPIEINLEILKHAQEINAMREGEKQERLNGEEEYERRLKVCYDARICPVCGGGMDIYRNYALEYSYLQCQEQECGHIRYGRVAG